MVKEKKSTKWCPSCKRDKGRFNFHKNSARYDGLQSVCKDCRKEDHQNKKVD